MIEPKRPTLTALAFLVFFVAILGWPLLQGQWLTGTWSDQYAGGYAVRAWAAGEWRATGAIPLWNPMIFGGLPYVATVGHGDVLYPTSFLRLFLPADLVLSLSFVIHMVVAGGGTYLVLRRLGASWLGGVVGGVAYQLSGILVSLPNPGHDGKMYVSALLPLAVLAVHAAVRERRAWGYGLMSLVVGLCLLSPHVQMTYYLLIASGLFALYCAFGEPADEPVKQRTGRLALALVAVVVGFGIAAPQIIPFFEYLPYSPRAEGLQQGFAASASYAVPWDHVPELFIAGFSGDRETYWGTNPLKLHSEYLGLGVIALAILGVGDRRRRLVWWLAGIGLLFLLVALGSATPFFRLWWAVMPLVKKSRAPGMAFFVVAFIVAVFAGFGVGRVERGEGRMHARVWLAVALAIAVLALAGAFAGLAQTLAPADGVGRARALGDVIGRSALLGAVALGAVALVTLGRLAGRVPVPVFAMALPLVIGADLWRDGRRFWEFQPPAREGLYRDDAIVDRLAAEPRPFRVLDLSAFMGRSAYPLNVLQGHNVAQVLGYFGFELRYYDELLGGKNEWRYLLASPRLWDLLAVRFVITSDTIALPGYRRVLGPVETGAGARAYLYEADDPPPYARVVPAAAKADEALIPQTLADARLPDFDRVVLLAPDAGVDPPPLTGWPEPSASRARVSAWRPGAMTVELEPAPEAPSYVVVSENWYVDWQAMVDGAVTPVLRGNNALITVPVGAGARRVELAYRSRMYAVGKGIGGFALLAVGGSLGTLWVMGRRRRG